MMGLRNIMTETSLKMSNGVNEEKIKKLFSALGGSAFGGHNLQNLSPEERQQRLQELGGNVGGARLRQGFGGRAHLFGRLGDIPILAIITAKIAAHCRD